MLPDILYPTTGRELAEALASSARAKRSIDLFGSDTKRRMAGPLASPPAVRISTTKMRRILNYEPADLTVSVEAGLPFADLSRELARNNQIIPLDGPFSDNATVGGIVAANISDSRRRLYGAARDLVIGMTFATLEGKLAQTGGMVVKNVAGLDIGKVMIGSFGTLAAIVSVNFKLAPKPADSRTFVFAFEDAKTAFEARDAFLRGVLAPAAVDAVNPVLAAQIGMKGFLLAVQFLGNHAVIERSARDCETMGQARSLSGDDEQRFWTSIRHIVPRHLEKFRDGLVVKVSTKLAECVEAFATIEGPGHAHAGNGIVRGFFTRGDAASRWLESCLKRGWKGVIEFGPETPAPGLDLWPVPGGDFAIMKEIKQMFDPEGLLNRGRLFSRI
ncbi:MAG TPA: FAD-binding oxidoreductase [Bryobacteraceae bacterium]|nr:FAD-binding oxidoreductase [Bryobacteraceae bacterium]